MFRFHSLTALLVTILVMTPLAWATDWPQFRGVHRDGISKETGLLASWPATGPKLEWKKSIGAGFSGISIVGNTLFTMYGLEDPDSGGEFAAAFAVNSGEELWRTKIGNYFVEEFGNGPRTTPTVVDNTVYCLGSYGNLFALDAKNGEKNWEIDVKEAFGMKMPRFGYSISPLVHENLLIVEIGAGEGKAFAALDTKTGKTVWTTQDSSPQGVGYNSPLLISMEDQPQFVLTKQDQLIAVDASGETAWSFAGGPDGPTGMPVFLPPNRFFISNADKVGAVMIRVDKKDNKLETTELWRNPTMRNNWSSSVTMGDHIYGFDQAALKCLSADTGQQKWVKRGFGKGSLIAVEDKLLILSDRGHLILAEVNPEAFTQLGRFAAIKGKSWTAPSYAAGRVYLRNLEEMACYDLRTP